MQLYKKRKHSCVGGSAAMGFADNNPGATRSQIRDNRTNTAQLAKMQSVIQLANQNPLKRERLKNHSKREKVEKKDAGGQVNGFGDNWEVLEIGDYLKRHQLKQHSSKQTAGKSVIVLTDSSVILLDANNYWRHKSADEDNAYYDPSHTISGDSNRTHFWTAQGYALRSH